MKLLKKLNYILLPVIFLVFVATGFVVYQVFSHNMRDNLVETWKSRLKVVEDDIALELRFFRAALSEVLNSPEMLSWTQSTSPEYQTFQSGRDLYTLVDRVKKNTPGIKTFQLMDDQARMFVSIDDNDDPFAELSLPVLPSHVIENFLKFIYSGKSELQQKSILYKDEDKTETIGLMQAFAPGLMLNDKHFRKEGGDAYVALLTGEINTITRTKRQLEQEVGRGYSLELVPAHEIGQDYRNIREFGVSVVDSNSFPVTISLNDPLYQLRLRFTTDVLANQHRQLIHDISMLMAVSILFSFLCLRILIRKQIVDPIDDLVGDIEESGIGEAMNLVYVEREDEVAILNNAYLRLLEEINYEATHDALTGMPNRRRFHQLLGRFVERAKVGNDELALLFLDLDNFKYVNDHYGHATGDQLLKHFSEQILNIVRPTDMVSGPSNLGTKLGARLAGDEFAVLLHSAGPSAAKRVSDVILKMFDSGIEVDGVKHNVHVSIGVAVFPQDAHDANTLLERADAAMYQAKAGGKNRCHFYSPEIGIQMKIRQRIEDHIVRALDEDSFELNFLPIFESDALKPVGMEVLLRYPPLVSEGIGPNDFIPIAESNGFIQKIDLWVLERSLKEYQQLVSRYNYEGNMSINISALELNNERFPETVKSMLKKYDVPADRIEFDITENSLTYCSSMNARILHELKRIGVTLALDGFGTGLTVFSQLRELPIDRIKIDQSFTQELKSIPNGQGSYFDVMLSLAKLNKLEVIAEGVESMTELEKIREKSCDRAQGFYLSSPLNTEEMHRWVETRVCMHKAK